jgi:hypothetical protein
MYRFKTKQCYDCRNLTDIYAEIDQGTSKLSNMCQLQLLNHQTRNLLSAAPDNEIPDSEAQAQEAIRNLKNVFTMVALTEDMGHSCHGGKSLPWRCRKYRLNEDVGDKAHILPTHDSVQKLYTAAQECLPACLAHQQSLLRLHDRKSHCWMIYRIIPDEETSRVIQYWSIMQWTCNCTRLRWHNLQCKSVR